jgi:TetR/AcrR family transcriptional repressor of nem operon
VSVGRPKSFDEEEVLERAMDLFWLHGYEGIGLSDLLKGMGISRQSLYDTFGSKRGLFVRVIEHYRSTQLSRALALLERDGPALESVKAVMRFFESLATDPRCRGCLVANTIVEVGPHDEELSGLLTETLGLLQKSIQRGLERAQAEGDLPATKSPEQLARALTNAMMGLVIVGKLRSERETVRDIFSGTLSMLD